MLRASSGLCGMIAATTRPTIVFARILLLHWMAVRISWQIRKSVTLPVARLRRMANLPRSAFQMVGTRSGWRRCRMARFRLLGSMANQASGNCIQASFAWRVYPAAPKRLSRRGLIGDSATAVVNKLANLLTRRINDVSSYYLRIFGQTQANCDRRCQRSSLVLPDGKLILVLRMFPPQDLRTPLRSFQLAHQRIQ